MCVGVVLRLKRFIVPAAALLRARWAQSAIPWCLCWCKAALAQAALRSLSLAPHYFLRRHSDGIFYWSFGYPF